MVAVATWAGHMGGKTGEPQALQALHPDAVWMLNSPGLHYDEAFAGLRSTLKVPRTKCLKPSGNDTGSL